MADRTDKAGGEDGPEERNSRDESDQKKGVARGDGARSQRHIHQVATNN